MPTALLELVPLTQNRTNGAMIALQLTIGGEYDGDCTTVSSHLDRSLSRSLAARQN